MESEWYKDFFRGVVVELWRTAIPPEQTKAETEFLHRIFGGKPRAKLLDVPCGSGRHSVELASRGYLITGVDFSEDCLQDARECAARAGVTVQWVRADMLNLSWTSEFDGAFCLGNSFHYFDAQGTRAFVAGIARALKPGGRFIVDAGTVAESILPVFREREWYKVGDILFLIENVYRPADSCLETRCTFVRGEHIETRTAFHWVYTVREIRRMLEEAGLTPNQLYSSPGGEPYKLGSPSLILIADKP